MMSFLSQNAGALPVGPAQRASRGSGGVRPDVLLGERSGSSERGLDSHTTTGRPESMMSGSATSTRYWLGDAARGMTMLPSRPRLR